MFKALLASSLLFGALTLPAAADGFDFRVVGGGAYGYQDAAQDGRNGGWNGYGGERPRPGWDRNQPGDGYGAPAGDWRLPPRQLVRGLRYRGFYDIEIIRQRPDVSIVRASARGRDMILVVDARSGDILRQRSADDWGRGGWGQDWRRW